MADCKALGMETKAVLLTGGHSPWISTVHTSKTRLSCTLMQGFLNVSTFRAYISAGRLC